MHTIKVKFFFFFNAVYIFLSVCATRYYLNRLYLHSVFKNLSIIVLCPVKTNILAPKTGAQIGAPPPQKKFHFLENGCNKYDNISIIYEDHKRA
jgi:hypothetical protein